MPICQSCGPFGSGRVSENQQDGRRQNAGEASAARCPIRLRKRKPRGSSRAAPDRLRSGQENHRRQDHGGACDILLSRRSSELFKTLRTSRLKQVMQGARGCRGAAAGSSPRQNAFKRVRDEDTGTDQTHHRCDHFEHRKHPLRPARSKRRASPHSQKDFVEASYNRPRLGILRNICAKTDQVAGPCVAGLQPFIHQREDLPISAMVSLRYLYNLMRRWDRIKRVLPEFASMGMRRLKW